MECRTRKRISYMLLLMMALMMVFVRPSSVMAATSEELISNFVAEHGPVLSMNGGSGSREADSSWSSVASYFTTSSDGTHNKSATAVYGDNATTYWYSTDDTEAIVEAAGLNSSVSETNKQIDDITGSINIHADTAGAAGMASGFIPIVNVAVGLVVIAIILLLVMYTGFDLMFLAFPWFRSMSENQLQNGKSNVMVKRGGDGESKYRFISDDAVRAYQQSIVDGGNKQPYVKYAVSRVWAYIALAIIITVLITGNYGVFIKLGTEIGEGIINMIQNIGKM